MSLHDLTTNQLLPLAIQKRLNNTFAGQTGFSGPEILDFFSRYSNDGEAASHFTGKSWMPLALKATGIETQVVELPDAQRVAIRKAQQRQFR